MPLIMTQIKSLAMFTQVFSLNTFWEVEVATPWTYSTCSLYLCTCDINLTTLDVIEGFTSASMTFTA